MRRIIKLLKDRKLNKMKKKGLITLQWVNPDELENYLKNSSK